MSPENTMILIGFDIMINGAIELKLRDLEKSLRRSGRVLIIGWAGSGKSFLINEFCKRNSLVPTVLNAALLKNKNSILKRQELLIRNGFGQKNIIVVDRMDRINTKLIKPLKRFIKAAETDFIFTANNGNEVSKNFLYKEKPYFKQNLYINSIKVPKHQIRDIIRILKEINNTGLKFKESEYKHAAGICRGDFNFGLDLLLDPELEPIFGKISNTKLTAIILFMRDRDSVFRVLTELIDKNQGRGLIKYLGVNITLQRQNSAQLIKNLEIISELNMNFYGADWNVSAHILAYNLLWYKIRSPVVKPAYKKRDEGIKNDQKN
jgi:hypothetical protein